LISEVDIRDWGHVPHRPIESKDQYEHYLKHHDWLFEFSDDHSVFRAGAMAQAYLEEASSLFDPGKLIWNKYAPRS
jgi:hypothetical protein